MVNGTEHKKICEQDPCCESNRDKLEINLTFPVLRSKKLVI